MAVLDWFQAARRRRILLLVGILVALNALDLAFTVLAYHHGVLEETNPFARMLLVGGTPGIAAYKLVLVAVGIYPMLRYRTHRVVELGAILGIVLYLTVTLRWSHCYQFYAFTVTQEARVARCHSWHGQCGQSHVAQSSLSE